MSESERQELIDHYGKDAYIDERWVVYQDGKLLCALDSHQMRENVADGIIKTYKDAGYSVLHEIKVYTGEAVTTIA